MNWEAIGAIGEVAGAVGVIATLAYLAMQIKQNTIATDKQSIRDAREFMSSLYLPLINEETMADINVRGMEDYFSLSEVERERFHYIKVMELQAISAIVGLRGDDGSGRAYIERRMSRTGYRQWWVNRGQNSFVNDQFDYVNNFYQNAEKNQQST